MEDLVVLAKCMGQMILKQFILRYQQANHYHAALILCLNNTRFMMALRLAQNRNSYDSSRIHKACRTDSCTQRNCERISDKDH